MSIFSDGLPQFLDILPPVIRERLQAMQNLDALIEVVLDYGRPAELRFRDKFERLESVIVSEHDIDFVVKSVSEFGDDNRAGIERTLHRISAIRNRHAKVVGLTCRVGRALEGTIDLIEDIVRSGKSILILGKPGIGKTTKLREVARILADEASKRVIIVDTSNEIAGDGDVPHPGIGHARRMQVRRTAEQHQVMIEAVENHMPEVIVIDEIGNEAEASAARTIAERGVQLIGTAHGQTLENLMLNPALCDLIGGIQAVTLSDDEARRRGTQKTVLERKAPPTFDVVIELEDYDRLAVHNEVQKTVDLILRGVPPRPEVRVRRVGGDYEVVQQEVAPDLDVPGFNERFPVASQRPQKEATEKQQSELPRTPAMLRIFPYGIARTRLERAIREKKLNAYIVSDIHQADAVIAIRSTFQSKPAKLRDLNRQIPIVVAKSNTFLQIANALEEVSVASKQVSPSESSALDQTLSAIEAANATGKPQELGPADARTRKMQIELVESKRMFAEAIGIEPNRRVRISPLKGA